MQSLYAHFQSENADIFKSEKNLLLSIRRVYELYLLYLALPIELADIAEVQMEEARNKVMPTEADKNPSRKFVDSFLIENLRNHSPLKRELEAGKLSWSSERDTLKKLWKKIKQSSLYLNFLEEEDNPQSHRKFIEKLYIHFILDNEDLYSNFQEKSIFWDYEDSDFAINMAMRYLGKIKEADKFRPIPEMYKDADEDERFVKNLFRRTIENNEENSRLIDEKTKNWEVERIAVLDVLFMKMAITEFLHFPSIPVKVTLNEYIEMAKLFSTPKSKVFINGVLDKLLAEFKSQKRIKKMGRGLMQ
ncbi:MAG: transcription antitermination factor NusB [Vicingaceae bacterium]